MGTCRICAALEKLADNHPLSPEEDLRLSAFIGKLSWSPRIKAMIKMARTERGIQMEDDDLQQCFKIHLLAKDGQGRSRARRILDYGSCPVPHSKLHAALAQWVSRKLRSLPARRLFHNLKDAVTQDPFVRVGDMRRPSSWTVALAGRASGELAAAGDIDKAGEDIELVVIRGTVPGVRKMVRYLLALLDKLGKAARFENLRIHLAGRILSHQSHQSIDLDRPPPLDELDPIDRKAMLEKVYDELTQRQKSIFKVMIEQDFKPDYKQIMEMIGRKKTTVYDEINRLLSRLKAELEMLSGSPDDDESERRGRRGLSDIRGLPPATGRDGDDGHDAS